MIKVDGIEFRSIVWRYVNMYKRKTSSENFPPLQLSSKEPPSSTTPSGFVLVFTKEKACVKSKTKRPIIKTAKFTIFEGT